MRAIIGGRLYDTETAELLGSATWGEGFYRVIEMLYLTANGAYFISGCGGAATRWARAVPGEANTKAGGEGILRLTEDEARTWAEQHLTADEYIEAFGEVEPA